MRLLDTIALFIIDTFILLGSIFLIILPFIILFIGDMPTYFIIITAITSLVIGSLLYLGRKR